MCCNTFIHLAADIIRGTVRYINPTGGSAIIMGFLFQLRAYQLKINKAHHRSSPNKIRSSSVILVVSTHTFGVFFVFIQNRCWQVSSDCAFWALVTSWFSFYLSLHSVIRMSRMLEAYRSFSPFQYGFIRDVDIISSQIGRVRVVRTVVRVLCQVWTEASFSASGCISLSFHWFSWMRSVVCGL